MGLPAESLPLSRPEPSFDLEAELMDRYHGPVAGIDEAGRGPWAGPVVVAAVILNPDRIPEELNDSKLLTPEMREDQGEIEAAGKGGLPRPVERGDLCGVLHVHTEWSDGRASIQAMAEAARARGFEYLAVCDHSRSAAYAGGLSADRLREQREEIERVNAGLEGFVVLAGCEVDILADGGLDYPDEVLAGLDLVVGSLHSRLGLPRQEQTERVLRAIENPWLDILGHPAGRVLNRREGADLDMDAVLRAAAEQGTILEINSQVDRLDLDPAHARQALEYGCLLSVDSDAHHPDGLEIIRYGVMQARRAWAEPDDIINTRPLEEFLSYIKERHEGGH